MSAHETLVVKSDDGKSPRAARSGNDRLRHGALTTCGVMALFVGLVVLPQTRANITMPSSAGASDFLVGP